MKQLAIFIMFCLICLLCSCAGDTGIEPDGDSPADGDVSTDGDESEGESSDGDADSDLEMEVELESEDQPDFETQWWEIGDVTGIQQLPEVSPFFADNRELIDEIVDLRLELIDRVGVPRIAFPTVLGRRGV